VSKINWEYDENEWVDKIYAKLSKEVENSIVPLEQYLAKFDQYKSILKMNAEEYVKTFDIETEGKPPIEVNVIKEDIISNNLKEKKLREEMPENI
jgi:hypothetical protein